MRNEPQINSGYVMTRHQRILAIIVANLTTGRTAEIEAAIRQCELEGLITCECGESDQ